MDGERPSPLACFITFTCYGTWLHGDTRGSVDRRQNVWGTPRVAANPRKVANARTKMRHRPVSLDFERRAAVRTAIEDAFAFRGWDLLAINVRSNHVHFVARASVPPEEVTRVAKARASRHLHDNGLIEGPVWTRHASTRYLWTPADVDAACWYVLHGQGPDIPGAIPRWRDEGPWSRVTDEL